MTEIKITNMCGTNICISTSNKTEILSFLNIYDGEKPHGCLSLKEIHPNESINITIKDDSYLRVITLEENITYGVDFINGELEIYDNTFCKSIVKYRGTVFINVRKEDDDEY